MSIPAMPFLDRLPLRWWFFLILLLLFFFPAYTTLPFNPVHTPDLVVEVLSHPLSSTYPALFPLFKLIPLTLIAGLIVLPKRISRVFYAWAGINLLVVAIFQNMANTRSYGFAVLTGNLLVYGLASALWFRAAFRPDGDRLNFYRAVPRWRYGVIPLALLAFWYPVSTASGIPMPDFTLSGWVTNEAGLTFCMMMPVYLAVLTLAFPDVNRTVLRTSGFIGLFTGLLNVIEFLLIPIYGPWMAFMHLPLLLISLLALVLSFRREQPMG